MSGRYEYQSEFARKYVAEGRAEALLVMLESRGLHLSDEVRDRILGCADSQQLDAWIRKAASVASVEELF